LALAWGTTLILMWGCTTPFLKMPSHLADPVPPVGPGVSVTALMNDCISFGQNHRPKGLADVLLSLTTASRDFRPPAGTDGYVLRMIPLNKKAQPLPIVANVTILLCEDSRLADTSAPPPLRTWHIAAESLPDYWAAGTLLDGYLFRLDWADTPVPPGRYRLIVRLMDRGDKINRGFCQEITFEEQ
jgi:hypothetical protein